MTACPDILFPKNANITQDILDEVDHFKHEWAHLSLSQDDAQNLERNTKMQADSELWIIKRKERITASTFGSFLMRKAAISQAFLKNIFNRKFKSLPTSYGTANEPIAKRIYIKRMKCHVHDNGLVVNPLLPYLGASPDGIVCDNGETGILEIKCPYAARNMNFEEACISPNVNVNFCLKKVGDDFQLRQDHKHWFQVQGQLLVTGAQFCDFVCYTKYDFFRQRIFPHRDTMKMIAVKLAKFYCDDVKPYLKSLNA